MNYDLTNISDRELGRIMAEVGCADRIERIKRLMYFAQQRAFESIALADQAMTKSEEKEKAA
jgi:hypothetical protein